MKHSTSVALMKFLSSVARRLGVASHVYIVGGAPRNFLLGVPVKDLDIVVDSVRLGKDSAWFAGEVAKSIPVSTSSVTNQYGVAILTIKGTWFVGTEDLKGEVIEIANARKESYGGESGKGYKPHLVEPATIEEDLVRREFTFNALLLRLLDLEHGPERAEVLDLLGTGRRDLEEGVLRTPADPDKTFSDDPTRCLRAVKFTAKYGFKIPPDVAASIQRNAPKLKQMPWDAVRKIVVEDILDAPNPRKSIVLMQRLGLANTLKEMLEETPGFAAGLSRGLNDHEAHVLLDLLDLGWAVRTPLSFLTPDQRVRVREVLISYPESDGKDFVEALKKPPIDQVRLFEKYQIPPKERQVVTQVARKRILSDPSLVWGWGGLEQYVDSDLGTMYGSLKVATSVAARYLRE